MVVDSFSFVLELDGQERQERGQAELTTPSYFFLDVKEVVEVGNKNTCLVWLNCQRFMRSMIFLNIIPCSCKYSGSLWPFSVL